MELESGVAYDYADVPDRVYDELAHASDRDTYFRENVRDEFIGGRAGEVDLAEMAHERREDSMFGAPLAESTSGPADLPDARVGPAGRTLAGGLGLVRVVDIPPYHYGAVFARKQ